MSDYEIGYGKPPKATQYVPGVSGNYAGRPKMQPTEVNDEIRGVLNSSIRHREAGEEKWSPAWQLNLKKLVVRAVDGDVGAAINVLRYLKKAERSNSGKRRLIVEDWLGDYPGQTAEEKTLDAQNTGATASRSGQLGDKTD